MYLFEELMNCFFKVAVFLIFHFIINPTSVFFYPSNSETMVHYNLYFPKNIELLLAICMSSLQNS